MSNNIYKYIDFTQLPSNKAPQKITIELSNCSMRAPKDGDELKRKLTLKNSCTSLLEITTMNSKNKSGITKCKKLYYIQDNKMELIMRNIVSSINNVSEPNLLFDGDSWQISIDYGPDSKKYLVVDYWDEDSFINNFFSEFENTFQFLGTREFNKRMREVQEGSRVNIYDNPERIDRWTSNGYGIKLIKDKK